jgi:hypothetical protein
MTQTTDNIILIIHPPTHCLVIQDASHLQTVDKLTLIIYILIYDLIASDIPQYQIVNNIALTARSPPCPTYYYITPSWLYIYYTKTTGGEQWL